MRVLVKEVVLGDPHVFEPGFVCSDHIVEFVHDDGVLGVCLFVSTEAGRVVLDENSKFQRELLLVGLA